MELADPTIPSTIIPQENGLVGREPCTESSGTVNHSLAVSKKKNISDPISSNWAQSDRNWLKSNRSKCLTARPTVAADVTQALHPQHHHQEEEEEEDEEEEHLE